MIPVHECLARPARALAQAVRPRRYPRPHRQTLGTGTKAVGLVKAAAPRLAQRLAGCAVVGTLTLNTMPAGEAPSEDLHTLASTTDSAPKMGAPEAVSPIGSPGGSYSGMGQAAGSRTTGSPAAADASPILAFAMRDLVPGSGPGLTWPGSDPSAGWTGGLATPLALTASVFLVQAATVPAAVPEPAALVSFLTLLGLGAVCWLPRRGCRA